MDQGKRRWETKRRTEMLGEWKRKGLRGTVSLEQLTQRDNERENQNAAGKGELVGQGTCG